MNIFFSYTDCRKDQYLTDCSCQRNCSSSVSTCDPATCIVGCECPDGSYDNGKQCVRKDDCYCVDEDGSIRKVCDCDFHFGDLSLRYDIC